MRSLSRMLAHENTTSDLLALLLELDPQPMQRLLGLDAHELIAEREASGGPRSRLDLVVRDAATRHPVAVLELKCASDVHGDQLERYEAWAEDYVPRPRQLFCTVDGEAAHDPWEPVRLADLFAMWQDSGAAHAAWLATEISKLLQQWDAEADGPIGRAQGRYVADIVTKRVARDLDRALRAREDGSEAQAFRTNSGNPMLMAWRHDPTAPDGVWLAVDVRSQGRDRPDLPWLFRPCVDVPGTEMRGPSARLAAHDHAARLHPLLGGEALLGFLHRNGAGDLAAALRPTGTDGFRQEPTNEALHGWRTSLRADNPGRRNHPVFYHDRGTRLATQFELDIDTVTRSDLQRLCAVTLEYLATGPRIAV